MKRNIEGESILMIIPTYNERENIYRLIHEIFSEKNSSLNIKILFVDDNSPDGTAHLIRKYQEKDDRIYLSGGVKVA